ncbi:DUF4097 family beta strand repeat-containing protein [Halorubrum sp. Hd13]|uniref:DUF4097 family beta strand repeat-containing protein n=1 Tax=Halorubrum sp. Hd13 TaxID=1480728 RepID=UPI000B986AD4|nr:DUF4097 family beta strand repeat-containing protein [Halorubrum sp. Hd13]OYR48012.1 hypothetical protein DJ81_00050 [Halorubrum sp. Hd13]
MLDRNTVDADTSRRRVLGVAGAAIASTLAGCGSVVRIERDGTTDERTVDPPTDATLAVVDATDAIAFTAEPRDDVKIIAEKEAFGGVSLDELTVDVETTADRVEITTDKPDVIGLGGASVSLELYVPEEMAVDRLQTADGAVTAQRVPDGAALRTRDGAIQITDARGDVTAETSDGDISVDGTDGTLSAATQDGSIQVRDPARVGEISTRDGNVATDVPAVADDAEVVSSDGNLVLRIGETLDTVLTAATADGEILVSDVTSGVQIRSQTESQLEAVVGDGTTPLRAHTNDGDVFLRA